MSVLRLLLLLALLAIPRPGVTSEFAERGVPGNSGWKELPEYLWGNRPGVFASLEEIICIAGQPYYRYTVIAQRYNISVTMVPIPESGQCARNRSSSPYTRLAP